MTMFSFEFGVNAFSLQLQKAREKGLEEMLKTETDENEKAKIQDVLALLKSDEGADVMWVTHHTRSFYHDMMTFFILIIPYFVCLLCVHVLIFVGVATRRTVRSTLTRKT